MIRWFLLAALPFAQVLPSTPAHVPPTALVPPTAPAPTTARTTAAGPTTSTALLPPDTPAIDAILDAFDSAWVVALGENHGHLEFHDLVLRLLEEPRARRVVDDVAVEWGNGLYQDVVDRYVQGGPVPWDSVTMAWRNTIVSPNTVWDAAVYERFFREVRRINGERPDREWYRVVLADSPVDWAEVDSVADLRPYFDRASAMADAVRHASLLRGRRALFIGGGLHVSKKPRVRLSPAGVPTGEVTPVSLLELRNPGAVHVIQSMGRAGELDVDALVGGGPPVVVPADAPTLAAIEANRVSTLRDRDGARLDVYGQLLLHDIVDAVLLWDPDQVTLLEADPSAFEVDWYWDELNRRSELLRGRGMDPALRGPGQALDPPSPDGIVVSSWTSEKRRSERVSGRSPPSASQASTVARKPGTKDARRSDQY